MRSTDFCHTHPVKDRVVPEGSKLAGGTGRNLVTPVTRRLVAQRTERRTAHDPSTKRRCVALRRPNACGLEALASRSRAETRHRSTTHSQASMSPAPAHASPESLRERETGQDRVDRLVRDDVRRSDAFRRSPAQRAPGIAPRRTLSWPSLTNPKTRFAMDRHLYNPPTRPALTVGSGGVARRT